MIFLILKEYVFFKNENNTKPLAVSSETFFNKQSILYVNICFREHVKENLFNLVHVK